MNKINWLIAFLSVVILTASSLGGGISTTEKPPPMGEDWSPNKPPPPKLGPNVRCNIRQFERIALTTHDAVQRRKLTYKWVEEHGPDCRPVDLMYIYNNAPALLGSANNPELRELIYFLYYKDQ